MRCVPCRLFYSARFERPRTARVSDPVPQGPVVPTAYSSWWFNLRVFHSLLVFRGLIIFDPETRTLSPFLNGFMFAMDICSYIPRETARARFLVLEFSNNFLSASCPGQASAVRHANRNTTYRGTAGPHEHGKLRIDR